MTRNKAQRRQILKQNIPLICMALPIVIYFILFHYLPVFGIITAFKDYDNVSGIFGSPWVGFENFAFFFSSNDAFRVIRNTLSYGVLFNVTGTVCAVFFALMLYEITGRRRLKIYQTSMLLPSFISWVIVAYVVFSLLSNDYGLFNQLGRMLDLPTVNWYTRPEYWPSILTVVNIWKSVGMNCIIYYAALMGVDGALFESAALDGAGRLRQIWHISLPAITPIICMLSILAIGTIMAGNFELFYQVPMDSGALYPTTDIIDTHLFRRLQSGDIGVSAAVGLFQSMVGLVLVVVTNWSVRKLNPENAMF